MPILFADDETYPRWEALVEGLEEALDDEVLVSCSHASQVLKDLVQGGPFDLVVLDIMMPPGDDPELARFGEYDAGLGVYELIRRGKRPGLEWARDVKVFVFTAKRDDDIRRRLTQADGTTLDNLQILHKPGEQVLDRIVAFYQGQPLTEDEE